MTSNLIQCFSKTASVSQDSIAIRDGGLSFSFSELKAQEKKYVDWLAVTY